MNFEIFKFHMRLYKNILIQYNMSIINVYNIRFTGETQDIHIRVTHHHNFSPSRK